MVPPPGGWRDLTKEPINAKAALLVGPVTAFYVVALFAIGLRFWARHLKKAKWRLSDYAVLVAAVFGTGYLSICWLVVERGGVGFPLIQVAPPDRLITHKSFFVGWLLQAWANTFVRLAILDLILQVFSAVSKFRIIIYVFEAATVAYVVACTLTWGFACRPFRYNWVIGPEVLEHCPNLELKFLLSAIFNLVLDVCILVLPMPMLWTLNMSPRKKIAITFVFGLGTFVCFATAWRTYHVVKFAAPERKMNFTIEVVEDALWSGLEITLGITNACLPVIPPALQRIVNVPYLRLVSFSTDRSAKNSKGSSSTGTNSTVTSYPRFMASWVRLGSSKNGSKTGIEREVAYSVDIESDSAHRIPMRSMGSTARLANSTTEYHSALPDQYYYGSTKAAEAGIQEVPQRGKGEKQ
jgi:hypothetical protein